MLGKKNLLTGLLAGLAAICISVAPAVAGTIINFDDGVNLTPIGSFYSANGVLFGNAKWYQDTRAGSTPPFMIAGENAVGGYPVDIFPRLTNPIVATFTTPATSVSITALDVGLNGARIDAVDGDGEIIAFDQRYGATPSGDGEFFLLTVSATGGISSVRLYQPSSGYADGLFWDNLAFTPSPEPATLGLLALGCAGTLLRRRSLSA